MPQPVSRPAGSLLRRFGGLVVLVGVVAMHQLAGGAHRMAAGMPAARAAAAVHDTAVGHRAGHVVGAVPVSTPFVVSAAPDPAAGAGHGMVTCLAVLVGLLVVLAGRAVRLAPAAAVRVLDGFRRTRPPGRGPPRALPAQICVLRT